MADFNSNITININLDAPPSAFTGFSSPLFIDAGSDLDGDRIRTYETVAAAQVDNTAGFLSNAALAAITAAFSQLRTPASVKVASKGALEGYDDALAAAQAEDNNFYTVSIDDRGTAASLEEASAGVAALPSRTPKLALLGSSDAAWLTGTPNVAFATLRTRESTAVIYHNSATEPVDVAFAGNRLSFNPDTRSVPWECQLVGLNALSPTLTDTQANFAIANKVNLMQAYGPAPLFLDPGFNILGRPIYEIVTRDWFHIRLEERVAALKVSLSNSGQKLILDDTAGAVSAQRYMLSVAKALYQEGLTAGHFIEDPGAYFRAVPVTSTDLSLQRVRIVGAARLAVSARLFEFDLNFTREALS